MRRCVRFSISKTNSTSLGFDRSLGRAARAAGVIVVGCALIGCDSLSFVPPKPEELREAASTVPAAVTDTFQARTASVDSSAQAKSMEVVLGPHEDDEAEVWKGAIRAQAGREKAKLRIVGPPEPPTTLAELVREALSHHPGVLLIDASTPLDRGVLQAIDDAQKQGVPVVVVGQMPASEKPASKTAGQAEAKSTDSGHQPAPLIVVAPQPFEVSAKQLVASALLGSRESEVDAGKSAILLINTTNPPFVKERSLAIKAALETAGITNIDELGFSANDKPAVAALEAKLQANPKTIMVFAVDAVTSGVIREVVKNDVDHRFFVAACYSSDELKDDLNKLVKVTAIAEFTPTRLLRKGVTTAAAVIQGRDVPRLVEFPIEVSESLATPAMRKAQAIQWEKAKAELEKAKKK